MIVQYYEHRTFCRRRLMFDFWFIWIDWPLQILWVVESCCELFDATDFPAKMLAVKIIFWWKQIAVLTPSIHSLWYIKWRLIPLVLAPTLSQVTVSKSACIEQRLCRNNIVASHRYRYVPIRALGYLWSKPQTCARYARSDWRCSFSFFPFLSFSKSWTDIRHRHPTPCQSHHNNGDKLQ